MELVLVRHGETQDNEDGTITGQQDPGLSQRGRWQARQVRDVLRQERSDAVYSSDLRRAHRTAAIIVDGRMDVRRRPVFRERGFGRFEGGPKQAYRSWLESRAEGRGRVCPPGGETMDGAAQRFIDGLTALGERHPDDSVLVVAHGVVLRAALMEIFGLDLGEWYHRIRMDNAGITRLVREDGCWSVRSVNEVGHLRR